MFLDPATASRDTDTGRFPQQERAYCLRGLAGSEDRRHCSIGLSDNVTALFQRCEDPLSRRGAGCLHRLAAPSTSTLRWRQPPGRARLLPRPARAVEKDDSHQRLAPALVRASMPSVFQRVSSRRRQRTPAWAYLAEIADLAPTTRRRKRSRSLWCRSSPWLLAGTWGAPRYV